MKTVDILNEILLTIELFSYNGLYRINYFTQIYKLGHNYLSEKSRYQDSSGLI